MQQSASMTTPPTWLPPPGVAPLRPIEPTSPWCPPSAVPPVSTPWRPPPASGGAPPVTQPNWGPPPGTPGAITHVSNPYHSPASQPWDATRSPHSGRDPGTPGHWGTTTSNTGTPRGSRDTRLPKALNYDGQSDWQSFRNRLERYAQVNGWDEQLCKDQLCWNLVGKAGEYLAIISTRQPNISYMELIDRLQRRFGDNNLPETYLIEL
ncbi:MAPK-interacting and spindle-stabilizing protein-like [Mercenaria mercenaria]|uniref:MAPK-interacting and spindle-stabilizing protein-like n=1 Tax=Mercenaria mercenaria TaxID=6596 RepID=UPI00234EA3C6|nr:MAPK-interacting and spindle-stabilizing protein-like [Mercenaria mercenaria]